MYVVGHAASGEQRAVFNTDDTANIGVRTFFKPLENKQLAPASCEDDVIEELGVGVRHGSTVEWKR